jgi:anti-sigma factor RsiW
VPCTGWTEQLIDHLAGELEETEAILVEQHLAECADCRGEAREMERILAAQASGEEWCPDPALADSLWRRSRVVRPSRSQGERRSLFRFVLRPLPAYAALLLMVAALAAGILMGREEPGREVATERARSTPVSPPAPSAPAATGERSLASAVRPETSRPWTPGFVLAKSDAITAGFHSPADSI